MAMRYFTNPANGLPHGYDDAYPNDAAYIQAAIAAKWVEVTTTFPPSALTIAKAEQIQLLETAYASAIAAPVTYMNTIFQADAASQALVAQVLSVGSVPNGFWWLDANNAQVSMTYAQLQGLGAAILSQGQTAFARLQTRKASVRSATTIPLVQAVVW